MKKNSTIGKISFVWVIVAGIMVSGCMEASTETLMFALGNMALAGISCFKFNKL